MALGLQFFPPPDELRKILTEGLRWHGWPGTNVCELLAYSAASPFFEHIGIVRFDFHLVVATINYRVESVERSSCFLYNPTCPAVLSREPELYQMRGSPFGKDKDGKVRDRSGTVIDLFPGVREILLSVHRDERFQGSQLAIASRTEHSSWAREVMGLLELEPGLRMRDVFTTRLSEIYRGTKVRHFEALRKNSGVPYEDMIFFDDWDQNCKEVGRLGVTCIECRRGLNKQVWNRGLDRFRAAKGVSRP